MAEYYPLISRAVAGLRTGTPEARHAIYARAKQALVGQLKGMDPPVAEEALAREVAALDEAINRVEGEVAPPKAPASEAPIPAPERAPSVSVPPATVRSNEPVASNAPTLGGVQRPPSPRIERPGLSRPPMPPLRPSALRLAQPVPVPDHGSSGLAETEAGIGTPTPPTSAADPAASEAPVLPSAPTLQVSTDERPPDVSLRPSGAEEAASESRGAELFSQRPPDDVRPAAPRPTDSRRPNLRVWIVALAALAAVVAVAFTAWKLRDNPEELARAPALSKPAEQAGKIVERADGSAPTDTGTAAAPTPDTPPASPPAVKSPDAPPVAPAAEGTAVNSTVPAPSDQALSVAYKAAILVDAPDEPQKVKTYIGTVVWRSETVNQGQDQPIGTAIRGEIDIPDAKVQLVFEMRRNTEPQFPASHTMELKFTVAADSPLGGIKQISVPQMRREDMPTGDPLTGVPVTITDNYFLVGLTQGSFEEPNLELIRSRGWFDIPMLLASNKPAKITFEKGASGERLFNEVMQSWKTSPN